jgi:ABC-type polysaccharide/polyol phosphate export permease
MFQRDLKEYYRWKLHLLFDTAFPILDVLLFVLVWGAILKGGFQGYGSMTKENYIGFLISGIMLWGFARQCVGGQFSHIFIEEKHSRTIQYLLASPISRISIPYGKSILPIFRSIFNSVVLIIVGLFLGFVFKGNPLLILLIIALTFLIFSGVGLTLAALGSWREDFADMGWLISYILEISAGIYYPIEVLPANIRDFLMSFPQTQAIQAMRMVVLQDATFVQLLPYLIPLTISAITMVVIAFFAFKFVERKAILVGI